MRSACLIRDNAVAAAAFAVAVFGLLHRTVQAQDVVFPGSTVQGDVLRGQGQYLKGAAMYDLYSARGRAIDAQTAIAVQKWNAEVYDAYMRARSAHIKYRRDATKAQIEQAKRRAAETDERLRTSPNDQDLLRGDALNALLIDLSNPSISDSSWRLAPIPLPKGVSVRSLFFRFAPRLGDKSSGSLQSNLIALGRLDPERGWPTYLPDEIVGKELRTYEAAYRTLLSSCEAGRLTLPVVGALDTALVALRAKVKTTIPATRNFRAAADRYVGDLQAATKIFDASTIDFAQEMIRDTHEYKAQTVAELLAYMRKYRLLFASAEGRPEEGDVYRQLYALLREQKEKLNIPTVQAPKLNSQGAKVMGALATHLADIAMTRLPKLKQGVVGPVKKEIVARIENQVAVFNENLSTDRPLTNNQKVQLEQIVRDLRFSIENPDPNGRIGGRNIGLVKEVIQILAQDLRELEKAEQ